MKKVTRKIGLWITDLINPYPECKGCTRDYRLLTTGRLIFLMALALTGYLLIQQVEGDIKSQCCRQLKQLSDFYNIQNDMYLWTERYEINTSDPFQNIPNKTNTLIINN